MQLSQRTARSEIHFYIQKLSKKGYKKLETKHYLRGYKVLMERVTEKHRDVITVKFSNNGWCSITSGNTLNNF